MAYRDDAEHVPVELRRINADQFRPALLAVLLPDRHRAERGQLHPDHAERLHCTTRRAGALLPVLERGRPGARLRLRVLRAGCTFEFGNVSSGFGTTDFGKDAQYGADQFTQFGYPEFEGQTYNNTCPARPASL